MKMRISLVSVLLSAAAFSFCATAESDWLDGWRMAGANPERTSWVPEEVRGTLKPLWLKPLEPYISMKVQVVAADGLIFVATSRGLYAFDPETGEEKWNYPTELPLGHSPTVIDGVAYVGCFDRRIHAVDAKTGASIWTSAQAGAGFHVNPLVVDGRIYAGNRDGVFYCLDAKTGAFVWTFATETLQPILFSAAYSDGIVYFAANDMRAYALEAETGTLKWKSEKLPGTGFHSWWPVITGDLLVLPGSRGYRSEVGRGPGPYHAGASLDGAEIFPEYWRENNPLEEKDIVLLGEAKDGFLDAGRILKYQAEKPWRRTMFVLDRAEGREIAYDSGAGGGKFYMPTLWWNTRAGTRYPPVAGPDGCLYFPQVTLGSKYIPMGHVVGWKPGEARLKILTTSPGIAADEPVACAGGGNIVYWTHTACRRAGAIDVAMPCLVEGRLIEGTNSYLHYPDANRDWQYIYWNFGQVLKLSSSRMPQFNMFGGTQGGGYGLYGDLNPPIPYNGKVYFIVGGEVNALSAWAPDVKGDVKHLDMAETKDPPAAASGNAGQAPAPDQDPLRRRLAAEVEKMAAAGRLKPGWFATGILDFHANWMFHSPFYGYACLLDYWHDPVDTICALSRAIPLLPPDTAKRAKQYVKELVEKYPPWRYSHVGWKDGASREAFDYPPDVESDFEKFDAEYYSKDRKSARLFYGLWKYAELFGGAKELFDAHKHLMDKPVPASTLREQAFLHNACIANRIGYLKLEQMAGYPESKNIREELDRLVEMRFDTLSKEMVIFSKGDRYERQVNLFRNFLHMVPELAERIKAHVAPEFEADEFDDLEMEYDLSITAAEAKGDHKEMERLKAEQAAALEKYRRSHISAKDKVKDIVETHRVLAPYWFVVKAEESAQEGIPRPYQDRYGIFQAMAQILDAPRVALEKYIDVPACPVGDLYYIENLCAVLETGGKQNSK